MDEKKPLSPWREQDQLNPEAARQGRVRAIKKAVAAGTYRIEIRHLADSLLRDLCWEEVLRNRRPPYGNK